MRQAIEGDELAVAHRSLHAALRDGETAAVRDFNLRLREHFDAFVVDADGAVPIWKVELPDPLARHVGEALEITDIAGYIARRVTELGLRDETLSERGAMPRRCTLGSPTSHRVRKPSRILSRTR